MGQEGRASAREGLWDASSGRPPELLHDLTGPEPIVLLHPWAVTKATTVDRIIRARDVVLSTLGLVALAPLLALVAVAIRLESPGGTIFHHERVGRFGRRFECYKFRTMVDGAANLLPRMLAGDPDMARQFAERFKVDNDPRVTRLGKWLRRLNIDELAQLWNVLVGDMSLVGPRPIVAEEMSRYGGSLHTVLSVRPGMTGLWQVSGRSDTTYQERVALDVEYVRNRTLRSDLAIIGKTLWLSLRRDNGAR